MKYIIKELNSTLGRNYDLIKFDALNEKQLLQLLVELLANFDAGEKVSYYASNIYVYGYKTSAVPFISA